MTGLLLVNLGTPDAPESREVRHYLRQFLMDPRVVDVNPVGRWLLVEGAILPFRPRKSAEAYKKIWTERGSPLLFHGQDLARAVGERLGAAWAVELGMRYQNPSIASALERLRARGCDRVVVFPLYPQYSSAATGSSVEEVFRAIAERWVTPSVSIVEPFYDDPAFIGAFAAVGAPVLAAEKPDHVLFSFHGLPERHVTRCDESGAHCLKSPNCCDSIQSVNRHCYRAQCFATARALANELKLSSEKWTVSFQSRLGRTPWIKPYTDILLPELVKKGVKRLVVFCPAFVADCLETLEEIALRNKQDFLSAGGESFALVPSLNATPAWADAVVALVRRQAARYA